MKCGLLGIKLLSYLFTYLGSVLGSIAQEDSTTRIRSRLNPVLSKDLTILLKDGLMFNQSGVVQAYSCKLAGLPGLVEFEMYNYLMSSC